jgi:hypothetical protein
MAKMKKLDRTVDQVIAWSRAQSKHPTQSWSGKCQSHCRQAYGVNAWAASAIIAWKKIPPEYRHDGGKPSAAPRGALLYYSGGEYGHVAIAIGRKTSTNCMSNDYVRPGEIDSCSRLFPRWGLTYLGWSNWTPFGVLALDAVKAKP